MNENLLKNLKELNKIQPDQKYAERSRNLILSSRVDLASKKTEEQEYAGNKYRNILTGFWHVPKFITATATIAVIILIVFSIFSYLPGNETQFIAEANEVNASIQIKLDEVEYYLNNKTIITSSTIENLNSLLGEAAKELSDAKELSNDPEKIGESLEKIKAAQETLLQTNSLLQEQ
ncbi:hypothetical protein A2999_02420 [Candidatus Wolfebacteria bacterium RIFCSPLOWO2_01_FULL_38_11]|uniref:DUF5667 domain-containing protein n=1 Tax=Candidatus Wolfebacteria bacterium RIFCSPLOWO2_01_FULL_38_11 TaxID=1802556 RepID=A0A1F8DR13_9BACT|nr:MAG: hypothetical protein A2999_02420 [Candidatus Wolfebacteria bacterium RIFCSPLOWO2_01_FULL_38_11]